MRNFKQHFLSLGFGLLIALATLLSHLGPSPVIVKADSSVAWNFSDFSFKDLGQLKSEKTIDGLTLLANEESSLSIKAEEANVSESNYTSALQLNATGSKDKASLKFSVSDNDVIKVVLKSTSQTNEGYLVLADSQGQDLTNLTAGVQASEVTYTYSGEAGELYLYAKDADLDLFSIQVESTSSDDAVSESQSSDVTSNSSETTEVDLSQTESADESLISSSLAASNGVTVSTYNDLRSAISKVEKAGGGKVYVKGNKIACDGQIALSKANANVQIIGVQNADGSYPELDFSNFMAKYIGKASSDAAAGVRISGSNYTLQNLIIEHAPDNGIQIKGKSTGNNKVSNCIVRYNNDAGLQVTAGAYRNTIEAVYSYRNCDVYTRGGNADILASKLGAGSGNTFTYCYAWDNSDDGWDSFDKAGDVTPDITYTNCAVWNNGNPDVFTGKYDFDHKKALDENLHLVQLIKAKDGSFASN